MRKKDTDRCWLRGIPCWELSADAGRREEALENLKKAEAMGLEMGMGYWLARTQEALARLES